MGRDRWLVIGAFATIYFVWGGTYLANYWAIASIPVFGMGGGRFLVAGALLYAFTLLRGDRGRPSLRQWRNAGTVGILFLSIGVGAVVWSQQWIPTSTTSLLIAFEPLLVMVMMWLLLSSRPSLRAFLGAFISICGMVLLIGQPEAAPKEGAIFGYLGIAFGVTCWAGGMLLRQRIDLGENAVRATAMQMLVAGAALLLFSCLRGEWSEWSPAQVTTKSFLAWSFLVIFGSILAFSAFNFLLSRVSADKVATNTYVNPVVAVFLGGAFNDEVITGQSILAGVVLLVGVYFINSAEPSPPGPLSRGEGEEHAISISGKIQ